MTKTPFQIAVDAMRQLKESGITTGKDFEEAVDQFFAHAPPDVQQWIAATAQANKDKGQ